MGLGLCFVCEDAKMIIVSFCKISIVQSPDIFFEFCKLYEYGAKVLFFMQK